MSAMIISGKLLTDNCPAVSYIVSWYDSTTEHLPTTESCISLAEYHTTVLVPCADHELDNCPAAIVTTLAPVPGTINHLLSHKSEDDQSIPYGKVKQRNHDDDGMEHSRTMIRCAAGWSFSRHSLRPFLSNTRLEKFTVGQDTSFSPIFWQQQKQ
jgi:hypothetical protein